MNTSKISVILLAAGSSQRMGKDNKLLLPYGETTIIETTLHNLLNSDIDRVVVVVGYQQREIRGLLEKYDVQVVHNESYLSGQVSSVKCGLNTLDDNTSSVMIALGDMPNISASDYNTLISTFAEKQISEKTILRPMSKGGEPGNPVIIDSSFVNDFLTNSDKDSSRNVLRDNEDFVFQYETDIASFFKDIDRPEDYEKLISSG